MQSATLVIAGVMIAGALIVAYMVWLCIQSLMQAKLLRTARSLRPLIDSCNAPVALCGPVRLQRSVTAHGLGGDCLWVEEHHQERTGYGKHKHWRTTFRESHMADFTIQVGDEQISLDEFPTEMQATQSRTDRMGGGFLSFESPTRVTYTWFPVTPNLTVLGRLSGIPGRFRIGKDAKVGLVISPHPPEKSAAIEKLKGIGGLFAIGAIILVIIYLCYSA